MSDLGGWLLRAAFVCLCIPAVILGTTAPGLTVALWAALCTMTVGLVVSALDSGWSRPVAGLMALLAGIIPLLVLEHWAAIVVAPLAAAAVLFVITRSRLLQTASLVIAAAVGAACGPFLFEGSLQRNPLATRLALWRGEVTAVPGGMVKTVAWSLKLPPGWYATREPDVWAKPETGAQLRVKAKAVPGLVGLGPNALHEVLSKSTGAQVSKLADVDESNFDVVLSAVTTLGARTGQVQLKGLSDRAWVLWCDAPTHREVQAQPDCQAVFGSFQAPRILRPAPSSELVRQGVTDSAFIVTNVATGSGWVFRNRTGWLVVTNAHVVAGARGSIKVVTNEDDRRVIDVPVSEVRVSEDEDLAAFSIPSVPLSTERSRRLCTGLGAGAAVWSFGFPYGFALGWGQAPDTSVNSGWVGEPIPPASDAGVLGPSEVAYLQANLGVNPGNSGGPVFNADGAFVGLVTMKATNSETSWLISTHRVVQVLEQLAPQVRFAAPQPCTADTSTPEITRQPAEVASLGNTVVQVGSGNVTTEGVVIAKTATNLLVVAPVANKSTVIAVKRRGDANTTPATVVRSAGLAIIAVPIKSLPDVQPLTLHSPSALNHQGTLHHVRYNEKRHVIEARSGRLTSKSRSLDDEQDLFAADFGLNLDEKVGPILNDEGEVVGVAIGFADKTNVSFGVTAEFLSDLLSPAVDEAAYRVEANTTGTCKTVVRAFLEGPLDGVKSVRLRRSPEVKVVDEGRRPEAIPGAVIAEAFAPDPIVTLEHTAPCEPITSLLQLEVVTANDEPIRTLPSLVGPPNDFPTVRSGRLLSPIAGSGQHLTEALAFAMKRGAFTQIHECVEKESCDKLCKRGDSEACLEFASRSLAQGSMAAASKAAAPSCENGNVGACIVMALSKAGPPPAVARPTLEKWCKAGFTRACLVLEPGGLGPLLATAESNCRSRVQVQACSVASMVRAMSHGTIFGREFRPAELQSYDYACNTTPAECSEQFLDWMSRPDKNLRRSINPTLVNRCTQKLERVLPIDQFCALLAVQLANDGVTPASDWAPILRTASMAGSPSAVDLLPEFAPKRAQ